MTVSVRDTGWIGLAEVLCRNTSAAKSSKSLEVCAECVQAQLVAGDVLGGQEDVGDEFWLLIRLCFVSSTWDLTTAKQV